MRVGVFHPVHWSAQHGSVQSLDELTQPCRQAEELGYDSFWFAQHHLPLRALARQPIAVAAALALRTRRIEIGVGLDLLPFPHASRVGDDPALVSVLFGGRIRTAAWYSASSASIPSWAGSQGLDLVCDASTSIADLHGAREAYRSGQLRRGQRTEGVGQIHLVRAIMLAENQAQATDAAARALGVEALDASLLPADDGPLLGDVPAILERLETLHQSVDDCHLLLNFSFGSLPQACVAEAMERFGREALPHLHRR